MRHPSAGAAAAGHRDPTTLLAESVSSTATGSDKSDDARRRFPGIMRVASVKHLSTSRALGGRRQKGADAQAHAEQLRRRRELQEHRFFRKRGALDYRHSVVFTSAGLEGAEGGGTASKSGFTADEPDGDCVPEELRAWYVASSSAVRKAKQGKVRHSTTHAASAESEASRSGDGAVASKDVFTDRRTPPGFPDGDREADEGNVFGDVVVQPSIGSGGAGTTSVNVLQSRATPRMGNAAQPPEGGKLGAVTQAQAAPSLTSESGATAAAVTDNTTAAQHAWGGRPPLRAHRYVEQPNGLFLDHARHADLLAEYAVEAELRHAQEREDARRARRWARVLYGRGSEDAHAGGGRRQDGTRAAADSANTSGAAMARSRYHWLYDAATYRRCFLSTLCYLQRVHVFLSAFAAGVSLLTLLAVTIPFPAPYMGSDSVINADASSGASAVLLLALFANVSATPADATGATAAAHVLPVLEQGSPAFAVFMSLFQVYHTSLLLCLCLVLVITGYAPVPWSVAENCRTAQRRRWLQQEYDDAESARKWGGESRKRRALGSSDEFCSNRTASSDDTAFPGASSGARFGDPQGLSSTVRRDTLFSSNVLGGSKRHSDQLDDSSRSALFPTRGSHLLSDDWLSMSMGRGGGGGGGGWASKEAYDSDELNHSSSHVLGGGRRATYAAYGATFSGLAGTGDWGTREKAQHMLASTTMRMSQSGRYRGASLCNPLNQNSESGSPIGSSLIDPTGRHVQPYRLQGGFTLRGDHASATLPTPPLLATATAAAHRGSGTGVHRAPQAPPQQLCIPVSTLGGRLSANNVFTRTFDNIERRAMQGLCNTLRVLPHALCTLCARDGDIITKSSESGRARGGPARESDVQPRYMEGGATAARRERASSLSSQAQHPNPAVPALPYLHLLLQPRLWCVVVALALTVVEIAFVDERTLELLWLAQPASWWSAASVPSQRTASSGDVILPHAWTVVNFMPTSAKASAGGDQFSAASSDDFLPGSALSYGTAGYVQRVLMAVYATRTVVLWVAFLLNAFF
ncbi:hypothetical protein LtaPh_0307600 [Leishmania tarentolae]|uniref:Transmembrane protein n=1 Tax=Leishmania tarentolae TaxID=5689 RepID=A0A640K8Y9_LEITA|nr:hypothetical protein LtaPh_0307600 [Leishmania tarentolae]